MFLPWWGVYSDLWPTFSLSFSFSYCWILIYIGIIHTSPTLDIHFPTVAPKYVTYLFILLTVSLVEQRLLILIKSMNHFFFNVLCFGAISKENQHAVIFTLLNYLCIFVEINWLHLCRSSSVSLICVSTFCQYHVVLVSITSE